MKRKLFTTQEKQAVVAEQRKIIEIIDSLQKQLICVDCGSPERLDYYRGDLRICYNCYCRNWKREKRAKHKAG